MDPSRRIRQAARASRRMTILERARVMARAGLIRPEVLAAFEASWERNKAGYRHLGRPNKEATDGP